MGVHSKAFGGWWMALGELKKYGVDRDKDCSEVVFAFQNRKVDVGTVRQ